MANDLPFEVNFPDTDEVIFSSENLIAVYSPAERRSTSVVITFYVFVPPEQPSEPPRGLSRESLRNAGLDSIHVIPKGNDWYQYHDMDDMLEAINDVTRGYDKIVSFGQSMGGYAAIHTSKLLNVDKVVALSPQFTVDQAKVDFDPGWQHYVRLAKIDFVRDDITANMKKDVECLIAVDPTWSPDKEHVKRLGAYTRNLHLLRMPFCRHAVGVQLKQAGLMPDALLDMLRDPPLEVIQSIRPKFRSARFRIAYYRKCLLEAVIERRMRRGDMVGATKAARLGLRRCPGDVWFEKKYCAIAEHFGQWDEAAGRWFELIGRNGDLSPPVYYVKAAACARRAGDIRSAQRAIAAAKKHFPNDVGVMREDAQNSTHARHWREAADKWQLLLDATEGKDNVNRTPFQAALERAKDELSS